MPVKTAKKTVAKTCRKIRNHWSKAEGARRREAAEQMQQRLIELLGLRPVALR